MGGGNSGANWRRNNSWDDEEDAYTVPPPSRSNPRNSSPGNSGARNRRSMPSSPGNGDGDYQEIGAERALAPRQNDMLPLDPSMNAALPGMPLTEEEERALGIRRPVYIPATDEKRKRKVSSWRVVSGVLSVILVCVASCGVAGFVGQKQITKLFFGPIKTVVTPPVYNYSHVPVTPVATAGPAATYIKSAMTSTGLDAAGNPTDPTSHFTVGQTIYLTVRVLASDNAIHTVSIQWFINGIDAGVKQGSTERQAFGPPGSVVKDHISYPQAGEGAARVYWDSPNDQSISPTDPHLAQTIYFGVYPQNVTPTAPPANTPNPNTTPAASPTGALVPPAAWREEGAD